MSAAAAFWWTPTPTSDVRAWLDRAACATLSPQTADTVFFPHRENADTTRQARALCATCPVLEECRRDCDEWEGLRYTIYGVVAGQTARQRYDRRRAIQRHAYPKRCLDCDRPIRASTIKKAARPGTVLSVRGLCNACRRLRIERGQALPAMFKSRNVEQAA